MPPSYHPHEPIRLLKHVRVRECGEKMASLREIKGLFFGPRMRKDPLLCFVRKSVAQKLAKSQSFLPPGLFFHLTSAYRPLDLQRKIYSRMKSKLKRQHPGWKKARVKLELDKFVFPPDESVVPYHATGGSLDVYLADAKGKRLKMWDGPSRFGQAAAKELPTNPIYRERRLLLHKTLARVGLTNYPMEFWHWSYGDSGWALRTGKKTAKYGDARAFL